MTITEILDRIEAIARNMHQDVNGGLNVGKHKATAGELKRCVRGYRDELHQLIAESGR